MENINIILNDIQNCSSIQDRIILLKTLNNELEKEKTQQSKYLDKLKENNSKLSKKYKKLSIDQLNTLLYETESITDQIKIYETINYKIQDITNELFTSE